MRRPIAKKLSLMDMKATAFGTVAAEVLLFSFGHKKVSFWDLYSERWGEDNTIPKYIGSGRRRNIRCLKWRRPCCIL